MSNWIKPAPPHQEFSLINLSIFFAGFLWLRFFGAVHVCRNLRFRVRGLRSAVLNEEASKVFLELTAFAFLIIGTTAALAVSFLTAHYFAMVGIFLMSIPTAGALRRYLHTKVLIPIISVMIVLSGLSFIHFAFADVYESEAIKFPKAHVFALRYLRDQSSPDAVILSQRFDNVEVNGTVNEDKYYGFSSFSERQIVCEGIKNWARFEFPKTYLDSRKDEIRSFFNTVSHSVARGILKNYNVSYVIVEAKNSLNFNIKDKLDLIVGNDSLKIYKVKQGWIASND